MKIKFHNLDNFTSYVAKNRIECRSDLDKSLWDMHQQVFDRCWCCGEMVAEKVQTISQRGNATKDSLFFI